MALPKFKPAFPKEVKTRTEDKNKDWEKQFESFKNRKDVFQRADGCFNVKGDVNDWGSGEREHLDLKYGSVTGSFSCKGTLKSFEGAPMLVCGNLSFEGELKSLKGFPKEVWGNVEFINHPARKAGVSVSEQEKHVKRWTVAEIKNVCEIRGKIKVDNNYGL